MGYRELRRIVQTDYNWVNNTAFDQWVQLMEKCEIIVNLMHYQRKKAVIQAADESKLVYRHYANILRIPDLNVTNGEIRRNRVLITLNALMPSHVHKSNLPWRLLWENFPYLKYPHGSKMDCNELEYVIGMPLIALVSQRPLENNDVVFTGNIMYSVDEIQKLSETLELVNSNDTWSAIAQEAVEVNGKIYVGKEDQLLCAYIERMQILLLAYKYWEECRLISELTRHDTMTEVFSNEKGFFKYEWYKSRFGTKMLSTYVNKLGNNNLRIIVEVKDKEEALSQYRRNVWRLLNESIYGKKYLATRKKLFSSHK